MDEFKQINASQLDNAVKMIGSDWMLITTYDTDNKRVNAMTASWGALGVLWHKDVCICFVRPQRYTHKLLKEQDRFSIAFMGEEYRSALRLCGRESGKDIDKLAECGLTAKDCDGVPVITQSDTVLICKKLYEDEIKEDCFLDKQVMDNYKIKDYHTFYVCEIEKIYKRI